LNRLLRSPALPYAAVVAVLAIRLLAAGNLGLAADEAYYWRWGERLDWGYYDHPPGVAAVIALGCAVFGDTELGVRAAGLTLQAAATAALITAAEAKDRGLLALLLLGSPLLALGGMLATPDVPLLACWGLGLAAASRGRWLLMGAAFGLGMLSKLTGWAWWPCVFFAWPDKRDWRVYAAGALSVLVCAPNLAWNAANGWVAYGFQLRHGLVAETEMPGVSGLLTYLGAQAGLLNPLVAVGVVACWLRGARDLWWWASLLPFLVFAGASIVGHSEPNWAAPAWLAAFFALSRAEGRVRRLAWWGGGLSAATSALVLVHGLRPLVFHKQDPTHELRMGAPLGAAVAAEAEAMGGVSGHVVTSRYQEASWIHFYAGLDATTLPGVGRVDQHELWGRALGGETLYVRGYRRSDQTDADALYLLGEPSVVEADSDGLRIKRWQIFPATPR